jgi:hypothetical protein
MATRTATRPPPAAKRRPVPSRKSGFGGTLFGVFIGVALGLSLAAAVAFYLMKAGNPYSASSPAREPAREVAKDAPRSGKSDARARSPGSISTRYCPASRSRACPRQAPPTSPSPSWMSGRRRTRRRKPRALLAPGGILRERIRRRESEGAARARRLGGRDPAGEPAGQGTAVPRSSRPLRQHRRAQPDQE